MKSYSYRFEIDDPEAIEEGEHTWNEMYQAEHRLEADRKAEESAQMWSEIYDCTTTWTYLGIYM